MLILCTGVGFLQAPSITSRERLVLPVGYSEEVVVFSFEGIIKA